MQHESQTTPAADTVETTETPVEATPVDPPEEQHIPVPNPEDLDSQQPVTDDVIAGAQTSKSQDTTGETEAPAGEPSEQASAAQ